MIGVGLFYLLVLVLIYFYAEKKYQTLLIIFLILYHTNLGFIFSENSEIFGLISFAEFACMLTILLLRSSVPKIKQDTLHKKYTNITLFYIIISALFGILYYYKFHVLLGDEGDYYTIFRRLLKSSLYIFFFITFFQRQNSKSNYDLIDKFVVIFAVFFGASTIVYYPLMEMGVDITYSQRGVDRTPGLFAAGGINTLSAVLGMCFGYFLAQIQNGKIEKKYFIAMVFVVVGIINTGSRAGLLGLGSIIFLYFIRNRTKNFFPSLIMLGIVGFVLYEYGGPIFDRVFQRSQQFHNPGSEFTNKYFGANVRFYKWIVYYDEMKKNPIMFFAGTFQQRATFIYYNVHNVFILLLYYGGLLFTIPYLINFFKILTLRKSKRKGSFSLIYILIPYIALLMTINDWFYFILPIFIMQSYGYIENNKEQPTLKSHF
jgi:hypothetical protein